MIRLLLVSQYEFTMVMDLLRKGHPHPAIKVSRSRHELMCNFRNRSEGRC